MPSFLVRLCCIWSLNPAQSKKYEVVIMGAGMAGIAAATELCENGMDPKDILIIEGSDYVGGRTKVSEFGGYSLNVGASWLKGACAFCNESMISKIYRLDKFKVFLNSWLGKHGYVARRYKK
eukprot:505066_1